MRVLVSPDGWGDRSAAAPREVVDPARLASLYEEPGVAGPWVRANMVATLDGAAFGPDGRSGSINTDADVAVFALLRARADVVVAGARTVAVEGYGPVRVDPQWQSLRVGRPQHPALVVVSGSARVPPSLLAGDASPGGAVLLATCTAAGPAALEEARALLGEQHVVVAGDDAVDPAILVAQLADRSLPRILCEGGPRLMASMAGAGVIDEWCGTIVPLLAGGTSPRLLDGADVEAPIAYRLVSLLEEQGALIGRWVRDR